MKIADDAYIQLERRAQQITGLVSMVAVLGVLSGAILIVADVLARWLFGTSVYALNEIMSLVFAVAVAGTLPSGAAHRVNLRIDLFGHMTSPRMSAWLTVAGDLLLCVFYAMISWGLWEAAWKFQTSSRATPLLVIPLWPIYLALSITLGAAFFVQIVALVADIQKACRVVTSTRSHLLIWFFAVLTAGLVSVLGLWLWRDADGVGAAMMDRPGIAVLLVFAMLWLMVFLQLPLAAVTASLGVSFCIPVFGAEAAIKTFAEDSASFLLNDQVATLPLFLIMGTFAVVAGVSSDLFRLGQVIFGRFRGGMAYTTIAACAGFGAVSGNSIVTSATFGQMALPEMKKLGYAPSLSTATVAAGGTLGALVPPSGVIILFALLTETSIGDLFVAAMLPALLAVLLYFAVIFFIVRVSPSAAPSVDVSSVEDTRAAFLGAGPVLLLFTVVIGGLYGGLFTVTESAAVGAAGAFLMALFRGRLNREALSSVFAQTTSTVAMIYALIFGGLMFAFYIDLGNAPQIVADWIASFDARPMVVLITIIVVYLLLGSVMDSFAVMIITVPIVTPIVVDQLGFDILFWGVLMLVVVEIGMITPPFGLNLFILKNIDRSVNLGTVMKGVLPFVIADLIKIVILVAVPALTLWLPSTMGN